MVMMTTTTTTLCAAASAGWSATRLTHSLAKAPLARCGRPPPTLALGSGHPLMLTHKRVVPCSVPHPFPPISSLCDMPRPGRW